MRTVEELGVEVDKCVSNMLSKKNKYEAMIANHRENSKARIESLTSKLVAEIEKAIVEQLSTNKMIDEYQNKWQSYNKFVKVPLVLKHKDSEAFGSVIEDNIKKQCDDSNYKHRITRARVYSLRSEMFWFKNDIEHIFRIYW